MPIVATFNYPAQLLNGSARLGIVFQIGGCDDMGMGNKVNGFSNLLDATSNGSYLASLSGI